MVASGSTYASAYIHFEALEVSNATCIALSLPGGRFPDEEFFRIILRSALRTVDATLLRFFFRQVLRSIGVVAGLTVRAISYFSSAECTKL